jgi:hypothetical protein
MVTATFRPTTKSTGNITSIDPVAVSGSCGRRSDGGRPPSRLTANSPRPQAGREALGRLKTIAGQQMACLGSGAPVGCSSLRSLQATLIRLPKLLGTASQSRRRPSDPTPVGLHPLRDWAAQSTGPARTGASALQSGASPASPTSCLRGADAIATRVTSGTGQTSLLPRAHWSPDN